VRHAEPILEPGVASSRWRLSDRGRSDSGLLGERLTRYGPRVVVSSEEPKAVKMAEIAAERLGIGCSVYPGLHEHDRTGVTFLSDEDFGRAARGVFRETVPTRVGRRDGGGGRGQVRGRGTRGARRAKGRGRHDSCAWDRDLLAGRPPQRPRRLRPLAQPRPTLLLRPVRRGSTATRGRLQPQNLQPKTSKPDT